ncbi:MAG: replication-relaxation family protein [Candidatus Saccharimonadales bacterium]
MKTIPVYRRPLNKSQIKLLKTLYRFRFASSYQIAKSQGRSVRVIYDRLKVLRDQEFIGQNYDSSYRIKDKPASYYLKSKAIRNLASQPDTSKKVLNNIYHDKNASKAHIDHCLSLFTIYLEIQRLYKNQLQFFTKSELSGQPDLPDYLPDALLRQAGRNGYPDENYFLDYYQESVPNFLLSRKIKNYLYFVNIDWLKPKPPTILMICQTKMMKRKMIEVVKRELDFYSADIKFLATSLYELKKWPDKKETYWQEVDNDYN